MARTPTWWTGPATAPARWRTRRETSRGPVIEVDLHTGRQTSFTVDGFDVTPRYTRPQGKAVLLAKDG